MKRKEGYRKKQRGVGTVTHQQDGSIKLSFQGQLIFPVVTQHSSARKTPPSQSEASTWLPGPLTLAPHCAWAGRGGTARDRESPKVTEQKWPVSRCPSTLRKAPPCCTQFKDDTSARHQCLLSSSLAEPRPGVTSISRLAVQGLGSECQNLKIKRQIVLIGCNYRLKRLVWRKNEKEKNP